MSGPSLEPPAPARLAVVGLTKTFGGLRAVSECSFAVAPATIVGLIGPNGSGKTTVFNLITRQLRPDAGAVFLDGTRIDGLKTYEIARRGVGRTFQAVKIFRDLSVWDNLAIAAMARERAGWEVDAALWLDRLGLAHLHDDPGENLSVGQQRLLELAMNLVVDSPFLMLDEPLAGVHPTVRRTIGETIRKLRADGRTFLIIEHDMAFVMDLCDVLVVMDHGVKIAEGPPAAIRRDPRVIDALLGQRPGGVPA
jgi:ABC-type branched-subunit amino acid transport system ATPase component